MTLRQTLRMLRRRKRMSQTSLARHAGVHRNTICRMERSPESASLDLMMKLAAVYGMPLWKLLKIAAPEIVQEGE